MSRDRVQPPGAAAQEPNGIDSAVRAECEQLRRRVAELESERDQYRQALYRCAGKLFSEEELRSIPAESDCVPLKDFLSELERIVDRFPATAEKPSPHPGGCQGMLTIVADDDQHLKDFKEYMP